MRAALDERARVRGARQGSVSDLEALFRTHWQRAFRAAYLVTHDAGAAEDIAQEAFLAAIRSLDRFARPRPVWPGLGRGAYGRGWSSPSRCRPPSRVGRRAAMSWPRSGAFPRSTAR